MGVVVVVMSSGAERFSVVVVTVGAPEDVVGTVVVGVEEIVGLTRAVVGTVVAVTDIAVVSSNSVPSSLMQLRPKPNMSTPIPIPIGMYSSMSFRCDRTNPVTDTCQEYAGYLAIGLTHRGVDPVAAGAILKLGFPSDRG